MLCDIDLLTPRRMLEADGQLHLKALWIDVPTRLKQTARRQFIDITTSICRMRGQTPKSQLCSARRLGGAQFLHHFVLG